MTSSNKSPHIGSIINSDLAIRSLQAMERGGIHFCTGESAPTRVLIVDDHPAVRRGLAFALASLDEILVVAEAASGDEAIRLCEMLYPEVVLLDLRMPGMGGISAIQQLRAFHRNVQVLVLTNYADPELVRAALRAGASGYLLKDVSLDELSRALQMLRAGHLVLSTSITQSLAHEGTKQPGPATELSERELQVLALVTVGLSNKEIARQLFITLPTARFHVSRILKKLGAANRVEAAVIGQQRGFTNESVRKASDLARL